MNDMRSRLHSGRSNGGSPLITRKRPSGAKADGGLNSVPVPREVCRTTDTREGDRHRLPDEAVRVTHKRRKRKVDLINLSGGGAMVSGERFQPMLWDRVDLHLGDHGTIECVVRWLKGERVGLEFAPETNLDCAAEERNALLRAVLKQSFPEVAQGQPTTETPGRNPAPPRPEPQPVQFDHARADPRHPLIWSGQIHYDHDSTPVRLRNISSRGALIDCTATLPVGAEPLLDLGAAGTIFATVTWVRGDQAGLSFQQPYDLAQLAKARPQVAPIKWEKPAYLREAADQAAWEEHWKHLSVHELGAELDGFLKR